MSGDKKSLQLPSGETTEGTFVNVIESTERFTDIKLEDGTVLKAKVSVAEVSRVDGRWDNDGNPLYFVKSQTVITVAKTPFRKEAS